MPHIPTTPIGKQGFTLLELSIVLVIIGLIVGGVLAGRELIYAAQIRATISQKMSFDVAANTFRTKYGYLPGDIPPEKAGEIGIFQMTGDCDGGCQNNNFANGRIDHSWGASFSAPPATDTLMEYYAFWRHLSETNLINGQYGQDPSNPLDPATGNTTTIIDYLDSASWYKLVFPEAKIGGIYWTLIAPPGRWINGVSTSLNWSAGYHLRSTVWPNLFISPILAAAIDLKIDDGLPNRGNALASYEYWATDPGEYVCTYGGADMYAMDVQYNINENAGGSMNYCAFYLKSGF